MGIEFPNGISCIANDIIQYLTGINILGYKKVDKRQAERKDSSQMADLKIFTLLTKQFRQKFKHGQYEILESTFIKLCSNKNEKQKDLLYINKESFLNNFSKIFLYENKYLAIRLYSVLTQFLPNQRLYLNDFLERIYPLIYGGNE